jgi:hypothetical protein
MKALTWFVIITVIALLAVLIKLYSKQGRGNDPSFSNFFTSGVITSSEPLKTGAQKFIGKILQTSLPYFPSYSNTSLTPSR